MTDSQDPLRVIATPPPDLPVAAVRSLVRKEYGLDGEFRSIVSERDQNFLLTTADSRRFVVKIANAAEPRAVTEFQVQALLHLEQRDCPVPVPRVVRSDAGDPMTLIADQAREYSLRIVDYLPGRPLEAFPLEVHLARKLGACLAEIGVALQDFTHRGDHHALLWDIRRVEHLRPLVKHIANTRLRETVCRCLDVFAADVLPRLAALRSQVIHNDLNPGNVLIAPAVPAAIGGVIDFGDMLHAPLIIDVAVGAAYLRSRDDVLALIAPFVTGYNAVTPLERRELALLYDLVRMRLATSITILAWRQSARAADDAYMLKTQQGGDSAQVFLDRMNRMARHDFAVRLEGSRET